MLKVPLEPSANGSPFEEQPANALGSKDSIFFKSERMYAHRLIQFNYTTYDVRRAQDVVNPRTTHCNIMLLGSQGTVNAPYEGTSPTNHPFLYAQVIGIYHVNVIYTGPGSVNYNATRFDFLWVRWYEQKPWRAQPGLEELVFPPMASEGAFGFVDPSDVLRSSHIIPAFSQGVRRDAVGMSRCARDSGEFKVYYIDR